MERSPLIPPRLAALAQQHSVKLGLSVGGWVGAGAFSQLAANITAVNTFATAVNSVLTTYQFDGVDIDWEYPGQAGSTNNFDATNDTPNFLRLLQVLRLTLGSTKFISAAVAEHLFLVNGAPVPTLPAFAALLDWINLMVYDNFGPWVTTTAHDAPFSAFKAAASLWHSAGFAKSQIVVGYPLYGRIADVKVGTAGLGLPIIKFELLNGGNTFTYDQLVAEFVADSRWTRHWDATQLAAWWGNPAIGQFATVPDPQAAQARAAWVAEVGLGGMFLWEVTQDSKNIMLAAVGSAI
ncbi:glycoside hydrolase superfamily [Blyttiomyces helicus]|uniref:Glycoside hydrolase superfamily n=1 Tax=Blyttiomyces helicus TaxID=388810 RepID=A0A4P9VYL4_9FUNG|nr:glycoside hydrolase superfamily [Blyttiomyces helicus]|eukprot:RKO84055.1 glycoside hydrolase superfamily [Blyttiomyces helicus]